MSRENFTQSSLVKYFVYGAALYLYGAVMVSISRIVTSCRVFSPRFGVYSGKKSSTRRSMPSRYPLSSAMPNRMETTLFVTEKTYTAFIRAVSEIALVHGPAVPEYGHARDIAVVRGYGTLHLRKLFSVHLLSAPFIHSSRKRI